MGIFGNKPENASSVNSPSQTLRAQVTFEDMPARNNSGSPQQGSQRKNYISNSGENVAYERSGNDTKEKEVIDGKMKNYLKRVSVKRGEERGGDGTDDERSYETGYDTLETGYRTYDASFRSFDTDAETQISAAETVGTLYQNDPVKAEMFLTAQLLQWKSAAEEGYAWVRLALILGAMGVIVTSIIPLARDQYGDTPFATSLLAAYSITFASIILILEFRYFFFRDPYGCRARLRNIITKHVNLLRLVWGRGWLSIFTGLLTVAQEWDMTLVSGAVMIVFGIFAVITGGYAAHHLTTLRTSVTDDSLLWLEFNKQDRNSDGYIDSTEFSYFVAEIGLELDDHNMFKAFSRIDINGDQRISFNDFKRWWKKVKNDAGLRRKR